MNKLFSITELPIILTLLIGLISYQYNQSISFIDEIDFLVYELESPRKNENCNWIFLYDFENYSSKKTYENVTFKFPEYEHKKVRCKIENVRYIPKSPAYYQISNAYQKETDYVEVTRITPWTKFQIKVEVSTSDAGIAPISEPKFYLSSLSSDLIIQKKSIFSLIFVRNRIYVNYSLLLLLGLILIFLFAKYFKDFNKTKENQQEEEIKNLNGIIKAQQILIEKYFYSGLW